MKLRTELREQTPLTCDFDALKHDAAAAHALMQAMKEFNHAGHAWHQNPIYAAMCRADTIMREWGFDSGEDSN